MPKLEDLELNRIPSDFFKKANTPEIAESHINKEPLRSSTFLHSQYSLTWLQKKGLNRKTQE